MPNCNTCGAKITKKDPYKSGFCNNCAEHKISSSPDFKFSSSKSLKSRSRSRSRSKSRSRSRSKSRRSPPKISPVSPTSKKKIGGSTKRRKTRKTRK